MTKARKMILLHSSDEIPDFASEAEEATFWATHGFAEDYPRTPDPKAEELLEKLRVKRAEIRRTNPISLRLDKDLEARLRNMAKLKSTSYQTLLKEFVRERLYEEEKRHKVI